MIIYENAPDKVVEANAHYDTKVDPTLDPPPIYSPVQPTPGPELASAVQPIVKPGKASNFICVTRHHDSIKGNYTIDPTMHIPPSLLPALAEKEKERKNLKLQSHHGAIDVEVLLVGQKSGNEDRATMVMRSTHGRITVKLNAPLAPRDPFHLTAHSTHNSVTLYIPRSYEGLLQTNGCSTTFSDRLAEHVTTFSESDSANQYFVGDFSHWTEGQDGWKGDEVILTSKHGRVKVLYIDEVGPPPVKGKGFLSRVLGLSG